MMKKTKYKLQPPDADIIEHPLKETVWGSYADLGMGRRSILKVQKDLRPKVWGGDLPPILKVPKEVRAPKGKNNEKV